MVDSFINEMGFKSIFNSGEPIGCWQENRRKKLEFPVKDGKGDAEHKLFLNVSDSRSTLARGETKVFRTRHAVKWQGLQPNIIAMVMPLPHPTVDALINVQPRLVNNTNHDPIELTIRNITDRDIVLAEELEPDFEIATLIFTPTVSDFSMPSPRPARRGYIPHLRSGRHCLPGAEPLLSESDSDDENMPPPPSEEHLPSLCPTSSRINLME